MRPAHTLILITLPNRFLRRLRRVQGTFLAMLTTVSALSAIAGLVAIAHAALPVQLETVATGLTLPVYVTPAGDGSNRLFIVEQGGIIKVLPPGSTTPRVFLDIHAKVATEGNEQGLLGLAFHPEFSVNRRFFVHYTRLSDDAIVIAEYRASVADANVADPAEAVILVVAHPFANHNGGMLAFGPDRFLYIGMGDGGGANDPGNRAQNGSELLGKILRIDVDHPDGAHAYSSPASNPFAGATSGRDEIFAYGFRNPWRFSFDRLTGELYVGDVGQSAREEIDLVTLGGNYGWPILEGTLCTDKAPALCGGPELIPPVLEYGHRSDFVGDPAARCSIIGGYVYRGARGTLPQGTYLFADLCSGEIFQREGTGMTTLLWLQTHMPSFGQDEAGELYVIDLFGGVLYRIAPVPLAMAAAVLPGARSVQVGTIATAFATMIATGSGAATDCTISPTNTPPGMAFQYQQTNAANVPVGQPNTPAAIPGGSGQSFVISFTSSAAFPATDIQFVFACSNSSPVAVLPGVNTLLLTATSSPGPDIIALGATVTNDGIAHIPGMTGTGFFSVATVNVGASAPITATVDTGSTILPVALSLCQTNPSTGVCINPVNPASNTAVQIDAGQTPTFAIFVQGLGTVAFNPGVHRAFVRFKTAGGATVGATSVAVHCRTSRCPSAVPSANWAITASLTSSCGCSTPGCSGSVCPCRTTPRASRPFTIRLSTKSLPDGPMMGRFGRRLWPVCGISRPRSNSISACSMATGPTPWPKKGGWHWVFGAQTREGRESHRDHRQSWLRLSARPRGARQ